MLVVMISLTGCYKPPKYTAESEDESAEEVEQELVDVDEDLEGMEETQSSEPEEVNVVLDEPEASDIPKPDCDGRLVPTYNFRNEVTGYKCMTDSKDFECPGHRAGETWEQDGAECTCKSNGEVVCSS